MSDRRGAVRRSAARLLEHGRRVLKPAENTTTVVPATPPPDLEPRLATVEAAIARIEGAMARVEIATARGAGAAVHGIPGLGHTLDVEATAARIQLELAGGAPPPPVRLDTDLGQLLYPSRDEVVTPWVRDHGSWEPETTERIRQLLGEGGTFLDVGAHVGYVSIAAARIVGDTGHGIAIEPAPENFGLLTANLAATEMWWVTAIHAAAAEKTGVIELGLSVENSGDHRAVALGRSRTVAVPVVALDDVLPPDHRIDLVKTDTQGTDHRVVRGLARTIDRWKPALILEYWPEGIVDAGDDPLEVAESYLAMRYVVEGLDVDLGAHPTARSVRAAAAANRGGYCTLVLTP